jgi:hypothetical protein
MATTADFRRDRRHTRRICEAPGRDAATIHPAASDSTAASTTQIDPRQISQPKNLLRCFQIFVFVAARHARLKLPLDRNPINLKFRFAVQICSTASSFLEPGLHFSGSCRGHV